MDARIFEVFKMVVEEHERAVTAHRATHSPHELYGILTEEVVEFFNEVRQKNNSTRTYAMMMELVQIMSVCARGILDLHMMEKCREQYGMRNVPEDPSDV